MSEDITIKKSTYEKMIFGMTAALIVAAFLGGILVGNMGETTVQNNAAMPGQIPTAPIPSARITVFAGDSPVLGSLSAPITMIEFSDFQCPFCGQYFTQTMPDIEKSYIDSGKVKLVFKNMPLENLHPNAKAAALAAECANEQGKFWDYHNKLFANQNNWANLGSMNATNAFKQYASQIGLDTNDFNSCVDSGKYIDKVNKDSQDGESYGATGTPTFFIGNEQKGYTKLVGAQPYAVFQQVLDSELK
jgi:protein-disulfide isomerase